MYQTRRTCLAARGNEMAPIITSTAGLAVKFAVENEECTRSHHENVVEAVQTISRDEDSVHKI